MIAKQPFEKSRSGKSIVPAQMTCFGIGDKHSLFIAHSTQCFIHLLAPYGLYQFVFFPMKNINGCILHTFGIGRVATTTNGNGCRKGFWTTLQRIPHTKASHRDPANIHTVGISNATTVEAIYQGKHGFHLGGRFLLHLMFGKRPIGIHPTLLIRALGNQKKERVLHRHRIFKKEAYAMPQLFHIVITAFTRTMQENHQRHGLCRGFGFHGAIQAIRKCVVAFHIPPSLKQRGVGKRRKDLHVHLRRKGVPCQQCGKQKEAYQPSLDTNRSHTT